jgi:hypothetical protein
MICFGHVHLHSVCDRAWMNLGDTEPFVGNFLPDFDVLHV